MNATINQRVLIFPFELFPKDEESDVSEAFDCVVTWDEPDSILSDENVFVSDWLSKLSRGMLVVNDWLNELSSGVNIPLD